MAELKDRDLTAGYKKFYDLLLSMGEDIHLLEQQDNKNAIARVKRTLIDIESHAHKFRVEEVDNVRKEIVRKKN